MSASTSPASSNKQLKSSNDLSSTRVSSSSLPPVCLPLASNVDPVALIDARIKVNIASRYVMTHMCMCHCCHGNMVEVSIMPLLHVTIALHV